MASTQYQDSVLDRPLTRRPRRYDVILHNDDFTTMDCVTEILRHVFFFSFTDAYRIMMAVHKKGKGLAGTYEYDMAHSKADKATEIARSYGYPLKVTVEPHDSDS